MTEQLASPLETALIRPNIKEDRHFVTALARGLELLACFRSGDKMLGNQELAERSKLPKSTVSRLTYTLTKLGYLQYDEQAGKYRLGTATLALGSAMLSRLDIRQMARPLMQELADFSHTMVSLGMRDRLSMIYVENCRSQAALTLRLDVGARIPVASTAMGRAYLRRSPATNAMTSLNGCATSTNWPGRRCATAWRGQSTSTARWAAARRSATGSRTSMRLRLHSGPAKMRRRSASTAAGPPSTCLPNSCWRKCGRG